MKIIKPNIKFKYETSKWVIDELVLPLSTKKSIRDLKSLVIELFKEENVILILFGSRARGDYNRVSDIDIGILPDKNLDRKKTDFIERKDW